jgi:uncharacterized protein (TIGR03067 family)
MFRSCTCGVLTANRSIGRLSIRTNFMKFGFAIGLVVSLLMGADAPKKEVTLEGAWKLTGGEADGKALSEKQLKDGKFVIKGEQYTVTLADRRSVTGKPKLDSKKEPKTIDIANASGPDKDKTCLGIYEIKDDEFRVVFAPSGKARPSKFATTADSGQWMHIWKRVKN